METALTGARLRFSAATLALVSVCSLGMLAAPERVAANAFVYQPGYHRFQRYVYRGHTWLRVGFYGAATPGFYPSIGYLGFAPPPLYAVPPYPGYAYPAPFYSPAAPYAFGRPSVPYYYGATAPYYYGATAPYYYGTTVPYYSGMPIPLAPAYGFGFSRMYNGYRAYRRSYYGGYRSSHGRSGDFRP